jgi:uncharacterized membrane protein
MNIALWFVQGLLGVMFTFAGVTKMFQPKEKLKDKMPWVLDYSGDMVKFVGFAELLGGLGLIIPWATHIVPVLTPVAAIGLGIIMLLAAIYHLRKGEYPGIAICTVLLLLSAFVAYGRLMPLTA